MSFPECIPIAFSKNDVLLPGSELFLPFEGSYALPLIAESLKTNQYIGLVQLKTESEFYHTGTLGKIIDFQEIETDKICALIEGIACFTIISFEPTEHPYIKGHVRYKEKTDSISFSRERLKKALSRYFTQLNMEPNWEIINCYSDQNLMQYLLGCCPLESIEKQCLLEAQSLHEQCHLLTTLLELSFSGNRSEISNH